MPPRLIDRVPLGAALDDPGAILDRFLAWVEETGLTPYAAQEEALLELADGRHVVLSTPTGSGKSLVALGMHFQALCRGERSFYTAPIKALVSEKFFALCSVLGPENVGMLTGDASINWAAPVVCCTQEVLANMALREGERADAPYVVMDEFHYYADRERGWAWQLPLLALPHSTFLLMSATLGNTASIEERLQARTGRAVAHVHSEERPVPLDFEYRETSLQESVEALLEQGRAPVYIVSFTQREAAEVAGGLTSVHVVEREQRAQIASAIGGFRFNTPYGKEMKRLLSHGIGLHHAGLLPKYRLLVEQLSQQGLLRVVSGTDTLGVGVNIPIRTVLFTRLSKYDGEKVRILSVRDFKQIAGRAGRKGFDERGSVVCQAPPHVVENKRSAAKSRGTGRKATRKKAPPRGFIPWNQDTFQQLVTKPPEMLESHFRVTHGMLLQCLQRERASDDPRGGYGALASIIGHCHDSPARQRRYLREAAQLFRSLRRAGIVRVHLGHVEVDPGLQRDFSLHHSLSLYLVDAVAALDPEAPDYALDLLSTVEAVLEDPVPILRAQLSKLKSEVMARLKAERVPYEERLARLDEVTLPRPCEDFLRETFRIFADHHPWLSTRSVRPKAIAREMLESYASFDGAVKELGLQRLEGLLLRYLNQVQATLAREVPDAQKSEEVLDAQAYLRELVRRTDSSLLEEWQSLVHPALTSEAPEPTPPRLALSATPKLLRARLRAELHALLRALSEADDEEAARCVRQDPDDPWDSDRFCEALAPFREAQGQVRFDGEARRSHLTQLREVAPRLWTVEQGLLDAEGEPFWFVRGQVDLREEDADAGPLVAVLEIRE